MSLLYDALTRLEAGGGHVAGTGRAMPASGARHARAAVWIRRVLAGSAMAAALVVVWMIGQSQASMSGNHTDRLGGSPTSVATQPADSARKVGATRPAAKSVVPMPMPMRAVPRSANKAYSAVPVRTPPLGESRRVSTTFSAKTANAAVNQALSSPALAGPVKGGRVAVRVVRPRRSPAVVSRERSAAARPPESIQMMVSKLHQVMGQGDRGAVAAALEALDHRAGANSLIALRMHAYWALQQADYGLARGYYRQILAQRPNDLPAGGNMALLEWRSGATAAARKRLRNLRELYPESGTLRRYLATMEARL